MKINLVRFSLAMHFMLLGLISSIILIPAVSAESVEGYLIKLKDHYQKYPKLEVFSLNYHYLGTNDPLDTWDYKAPERYMALRMVEIDLVRKQFVERDIHHFSGGQTYNRSMTRMASRLVRVFSGKAWIALKNLKASFLGIWIFLQ